jgi:hypothetical protein
MNINEMDDTQEDEVKGMNAILGNSKAESNGNKRGITESIDMVKTIKSL